jgi:hypothetical protein
MSAASAAERRNMLRDKETLPIGDTRDPTLNRPALASDPSETRHVVRLDADRTAPSSPRSDDE